jgi:hypothetical protein
MYNRAINDDLIQEVAVEDISITAAKLASDAVETAKIKDDAVTEAKIADGSVTAAKLSGLVGFSGLANASIAAGKDYDKNTDETDTLIDDVSYDRTALVVVAVTEAFADGSGSAPTFQIKAQSAVGDIMADDVIVDGASVGDVFIFAGDLPATKDLQVIGVPKTGNGTGAINVTAFAIKSKPT